LSIFTNNNNNRIFDIIAPQKYNCKLRGAGQETYEYHHVVNSYLSNNKYNYNVRRFFFRGLAELKPPPLTLIEMWTFKNNDEKISTSCISRENVLKIAGKHT